MGESLRQLLPSKQKTMRSASKSFHAFFKLLNVMENAMPTFTSSSPRTTCLALKKKYLELSTKTYFISLPVLQRKIINQVLGKVNYHVYVIWDWDSF